MLSRADAIRPYVRYGIYCKSVLENQASALTPPELQLRAMPLSPQSAAFCSFSKGERNVSSRRDFRGGHPCLDWLAGRARSLAKRGVRAELATARCRVAHQGSEQQVER